MNKEEKTHYIGISIVAIAFLIFGMIIGYDMNSNVKLVELDSTTIDTGVERMTINEWSKVHQNVACYDGCKISHVENNLDVLNLKVCLSKCDLRFED